MKYVQGDATESMSFESFDWDYAIIKTYRLNYGHEATSIILPGFENFVYLTNQFSDNNEFGNTYNLQGDKNSITIVKKPSAQTRVLARAILIKINA